PSISDGRLSYQFSSDGYIRRSVYAYERRVCYITLNRPEEEHSGPEDIPSVKAILNTLLPLEILLPVAENNKSKTINNDHPQKSCGAQPTTDEKY
ncbi:hypothetical protein, partial [Escherichia coli]|uniref:hypothetical protein n=1 Tax=Escherichia coli TaxID=562 RepID=UPI00201A4A32